MVEVGVPTHEVRFTVLGRAAQAVYPALIGPLLIVMSLLEPALLADWIYLGLGGGLLLTWNTGSQVWGSGSPRPSRVPPRLEHVARAAGAGRES